MLQGHEQPLLHIHSSDEGGMKNTAGRRDERGILRTFS